MSITTPRVTVYGAYGHTGRFVVAELLRRGVEPVVSGRDATRLAATGLEARPAATGDPTALAAAFAGADAVINVAGPFLDTAVPVAAAAVRAGAHYLDVSAEQAPVRALAAELGATARAAGVSVVPAMSFFGGLADLLATAAVGDRRGDDVTVAIGIDRWWPTAGTRITGRRTTAPRLVVTDGALAPADAEPEVRTWHFPEPLGAQEVVAHPFSETVLIADHLPVRSVRTFLTTAPLADLRDPATPAPEAVDDLGRSAQRFTVEVDAGGRRISASGRDIYAVTAPLVVEAALRLGRDRPGGVWAPGARFDAEDFLAALTPEPLSLRHPVPAR